jgi:hypothetical protein
VNLSVKPIKPQSRRGHRVYAELEVGHHRRTPTTPFNNVVYRKLTSKVQTSDKRQGRSFGVVLFADFA